MDKAPDYESGDSRFDSWQGRNYHLLTNANKLVDGHGETKKNPVV